MTGNCEASSLKWCLWHFTTNPWEKVMSVPRHHPRELRFQGQTFQIRDVGSNDLMGSKGETWNNWLPFFSEMSFSLHVSMFFEGSMIQQNTKEGILREALVSLMFCCASVSAPPNPISSSVLPAVETSNHYKDSRNHHLHLQKARLLNLEMPELGGEVAKWPFIMDKRKRKWNQSLTNGPEWWQILKPRG